MDGSFYLLNYLDLVGLQSRDNPHCAPLIMSKRHTETTAFDFSRDSRLGIKGRMLSNTGMLGGARLLSALMGVATLILAAKTLSNNAAFGTLLFTHAYMLFFSEIASVQIWQAIIRFGSDEVKSENAQRLSALMKTGIIFDLASAVVAFILAVLCFDIFLWAVSTFSFETDTELLSFDSGLTIKQIVWAYCTVILFRQLNIAIGIFRLFDKFSALAIRSLVMPTVRLVGVTLAYYQGWGFIGILSVWYLASLLSYLVLQILTFIEVKRRGFLTLILREKICKSKDFPKLYAFVSKTYIDSTVSSVNAYFPALAIMIIFGPAILAIYRIAEEISRLLSRGISLFEQVLFPELSRMAADVDFQTLLKTSVKSSIGIGVIGFAISLIVLLFGDAVLEVAFDESFADASTLAVMLLVATSIIGISLPFFSIFYALVRPEAAITARLIGGASFISLFFIFSRSQDIHSIGWAAIMGAIIEANCAIFMARKMIKSAKAP